MLIMNEIENYRQVIFYDGVCMLCNRFIRFVLRWDRKKEIFISPLQSAFAGGALKGFDIDPGKLDTVVFYKDGRIHTRSDVVFAVFRSFGFPWTILNVFELIPRKVRDDVYNWVARNRYGWFGKSNDICPVPDDAQKRQIIR